MITVTNIPSKDDISTKYAITLNGKKADAMYSRVSAIPFNRDWPGKQRSIEQTELASVLSFAADEDVTLKVKATKTFEKAVVRPLSEKITPVVSDDGTIEFTITRPGQYVLELDGISEALHIFVDPVVDYGVCPDDENVLYYGPGVHHIGQVELGDNTTVYIDRDAIVHGAFLGIDAENIRILGNGVLDGNWEERQNHNFIFPYDFSRVPEHMWAKDGANHVFSFKPDAKLLPKREGEYVPGTGSSVYGGKEHFRKYLEGMAILKAGLHFYKCRNVEFNGIIINGTAGLSNTMVGCDDVTFDNVKVIGMWKHNNDGIDFFNCRNCTVRNSFVRAFDDVICVKGQTGWDTQNVENILIDNCVVWCDWARTLEVGIDTVASEMKNITFRDCDCLHHSMTVLHMSNDDRAKIQNVVYEDIRVEYSVHDAKSLYQHSDEEEFVWQRHTATLFATSINGPDIWSSDGIAGTTTDVTVRNIQVFTEDDIDFPGMKIEGKDAEHLCKNITIEDIYFNGKKLTTAEELNLKTNEFVENVVIK